MASSKLILTLLTAVLFLTSCANPASDKPQAVTNEAAPVAATSPATAGEKYVISSETSQITFVASKVTGSHNGSFKKFSGMINFSGQPETSSVSITIDTNSVETDTPDLTKHLKTPDFFDVAKYPEATFVSTTIKPGGASGASHTVTGNLTLHGVTKAITFPATIAVTSGAINVDSTFSINRKDFGINYAGAANNLIRDEVVMTLKVRAVK
jgi:polyisoprenoid-binding protein YceI